MIGFRDTTLEQLSVDHEIGVNTLTGSARLTVPIRTTAGRESFGPQLALGYGSGEQNSSFGVGWFLGGVPSIGLDTRRSLPEYRDDTDRYTYAGGQELVPHLWKQGTQWLPTAETRGAYRIERFRARVERSFERFEKWTDLATSRAHWLVYARNGAVSVFGTAADNSTRLADPADPDRRTFQWLLEAQYHPKGSAIRYEYKPEDGTGVDSTPSFESSRGRPTAFAQRYLKRILYGNSRPLSHAQPTDAQNRWHFEIVLDYGEHRLEVVPTPTPVPAWTTRQDPFSGYRTGFEIRTYRLCRRILMFHRFPELGSTPCLVGATELTHREDPAGSVLERLVYRGYRKDLTAGTSASRPLPPLVFSYSGTNLDAGFEAPEAADNVPAGLDGFTYQWIDLRNEGLPGILHARQGSWYYKPNLGDGRFGPVEIVDEVPAAVSAAFQLQDFDGDGNLNLVGFEGREAGYYQRDRHDGRWEGFRTFQGLPRVDFANARVQWVDLNGDGYSDLLVDHHDHLAWYPSAGPDGFDAHIELAKPDAQDGGAPTLIQDRGLQTFFADMNGDGLVDMVRVENGRVEYWPNLGRGTFGRGVLMEDAPVIEGFGQLDADRVRFVDLDGSGTAALLYLGRGEIRYWLNQSGNRFGAEVRLPNLPYIDELSSAQVFDFLGDGSRCLVWSTPLPTREGNAIQYLRLTGSVPPRMLLAISNSAGRESRFSYRSSAREYLRDARNGQPWRTLLPQHPMVVDRLDGADLVGSTRLSSRYEYRDGYFDDAERRFVGFGLVDVYDSDQVGVGGPTATEEFTPPSLVRSWYHTGASSDADRSADFYTRDVAAVRLPAPVIEQVATLTTEEQLDAYRAIAGLEWRQEFYAMRPDGTRSVHPLRTTEMAYRITPIQPSVDDVSAVFTIAQSESLRHEYEEDGTDPRVSHDLLLASGTYGEAETLASIAYPRRAVGPDVRPQQRVLHAELSYHGHAHFDQAARFEVGIETDERRYSLSGIATGAATIFTRAHLQLEITAALADPLALHDTPTGLTPQAQLITRRRNLFWNDARDAVLNAGQVGAVTLLHHVERAAFPEAAVAPRFGGRVTDQMLSADGFYRRAESYWWAEDTTYRYHGAVGFFRLEQETNPGGSRQTIEFDQHFLLVTATTDVFGNRIESTPDYQVMASARVRDANENVSETLYDPLGISVVVGLRGQQLGSDGNAHPVGAADLATYVPLAGLTAAALLADPAAAMQDASRFYFHDFGAFERGEGPPRVIRLERESHVNDGEGTAPSASRIRVSIDYVDGFGRIIQTKARADAGLAILRNAAGTVVVDGDSNPVLADSTERWLTSGHVVFNNRGWVVRRYEPLFSTRPDFESDAALRRYGVVTRTFFDPVGRVVRVELPNGTLTTNAYTAWETRSSDENDTVAGSAYEAARGALPTAHPEKVALTQALEHRQTPTILELDNLGRAFRLRTLAERGGGDLVSTTFFGVFGLPDRVMDARGLEVFSYRYDMLGRTLFAHSVDAGDSWTLPDGHDRLVHRWDARGIHTRLRYDQNGRTTETIVDGALGLNNTVERRVYGDNPVVAQAAVRNARGRLVELYDDAGVQIVDRYHMDGSVLENRRSLRTLFKTTVDWSAPAAVALDAAVHRSRARCDGLGRLVSHSLPDGTTREYDHDALGFVSEVRLTTADGQLNRKVVATGIETNARGQRIRLELGNGVETIYDFDDQTFRLERLHTRRAAGAAREYMDIGYTYDPAGNIVRWLDAVQSPGSTSVIQGLTTSPVCDFTYDALYQLKSATGRVHQALFEHDYRSGIADVNALKGTRHLTLNNGAAVERYTRTYDYDRAGNIQRVRHQGVTRSWTTEMWISPSSNRRTLRKDLNGNDVVAPESRFDANGNVIALPHLRAMDWNYADRLSRAVIIDRSAGGGPDDAEYYVYGGDGVRVRRVTERVVNGSIETADVVYLDGCEIRRISQGGATSLERRTSHVTDGAARLLTLHQWTVDQTGRETADVATKKLHYLVGNHLGSVSLELDDAGEIISYEEFFPYGATSFIAGTNVRDIRLKEYRYSGKLCDDATGLYCYEYRYYAPFVGGWLSPDPLGPVDGLNLYRFVRNNPIRFVDANGLQSDDVLAQGPKEETATEAEAISYYNRNWAFDTGRRITNLEPIANKPGWWQIAPGGIRPLTQAEIDRLRSIVEINESSPEAAEILLALEDINLEELLKPSPSEEKKEPPPKEGGGGDQKGAEGDGDKTAHPADGSLGKGSTAKGQTGESGSNGGGATGDGKAAGAQGNGLGGGGVSDVAGQGGTGTGLGTVPGTGAGGAGTGADGQQSGGGKDGGQQGGKEGGKVGGKEGGTGTELVPPPPPGVKISEDGIPYSPDLQLPEVMPEAGIPVTDPSQISFGNGNTDPRGNPATDNGNGVRPGGVEGGKRDGTPGATGEGTGTGSDIGGAEGGVVGGGRGMKGGMGTHELPSWLSWIDKGIDWFQTGLDVVGLIPGLGEIADGLNGLISLARGDYAGAALSFAAMIPFAGWGATAAKFGRKGLKAAGVLADGTKAVVKHGDEAAAVGTTVTKQADEAAQVASKSADELAGGAKAAPSSPGTATVHYRPNPDGSPHWTVETNVPGAGKLETHQVVTAPKGRKTQILKVEPGDFPSGPTASKTVVLPDPNAARSMQGDQLARGETGQWIPKGTGANSCATAVCEVVAAGGGRFPSDPAQAGQFLRNLFGIK